VLNEGSGAGLTFNDNQDVRAGQLLVEIDPRDFDVRLKQAEAQRLQAAAQLEQSCAQPALQQAQLDQAQANASTTTVSRTWWRCTRRSAAAGNTPIRTASVGKYNRRY
jgi:multidrug resistance efflux pump